MRAPSILLYLHFKCTVDVAVVECPKTAPLVLAHSQNRRTTSARSSNSVRRHEFAYTESGTRLSYLGGSLVKRARGFFIGVDVFSFRCAFNVGFGILLAAALIVRIRFFLCVCDVRWFNIFLFHFPCDAERESERVRRGYYNRGTCKRNGKMYDEMIMMMMMLLRRWSIVVTNNNCFRIILFTLSQNETKFTATTNQQKKRCGRRVKKRRLNHSSAWRAYVCAVRIWIYASFIR